MRQTLKDRRRQLHLYRGTPMSRVLTMIGMLVILGLVIVRARDPNTWRWFSRENDGTQVITASGKSIGSPPLAEEPAFGKPESPHGKSSAPGTAAVTGEKPTTGDENGEIASEPTGLEPTGPTDLDQSEQDDIKDPISIVTDGDLEILKEENVALYQILSWVDHQSAELLQKRANKVVLYSDFRMTPERMRLQLVELNLSVRQIVPYALPPKNGLTKPMTTYEGHPIYRVCGFTQEGSTNLYMGIVTDLPKGMPIGTSIDVNAKLVGYFFKLQGYFSAVQQLEAEQTRKKAKPLKAPLILGRLIWVPSPSMAAEAPPVWLLASIGGAVVAVIVGWTIMAMAPRGGAARCRRPQVLAARRSTLIHPPRW